MRCLKDSFDDFIINGKDNDNDDDAPKRGDGGVATIANR